MVIAESIEKLTHLCETIPLLLEQISESDFAYKPTPDKWNKKEILGHLIDSATNNHQRFIRIQYENQPVISYDQNKWNDLSNYTNLAKNHLIAFWLIYNQHLIEVMKAIEEENLNLMGVTKDGQKFPLHFYIADYVHHLEHHLNQLTTRSFSDL